MANAPARQPKRSFAGLLKALPALLWKLLLQLIIRTYAIVLIAVVLYLSLSAFLYLVNNLMLAGPPPDRIVDLPKKLNAEVLAKPTAEFTAVVETDNVRTPLSHYHKIDTWYIPDRANGCTTSGCHAPLPHGANKANRAFLNMHAMTLHCGVCHMEVADEHPPLPLEWYNPISGAPSEPPPLLRAYGWLMAHQATPKSELTPADQATIVSLLQAAVNAAGGEPSLEALAQHFAAVRVQSPAFQQILAAAPDTVAYQFRGAYGAKLALIDAQTGAPLLQHPGSEAAVAEFRARGDELTGEARADVLNRVHTRRRSNTRRCTDCHTPTNSLVDLAGLGYPPARIERLTHPLLMEAVQRIADGQTFYMPGFVGPGTTSRPVQPLPQEPQP